jgi:hypothetical protein
MREREFLRNPEQLELVAHTCNPSYLGGRDQEDCGLKKVGEG